MSESPDVILLRSADEPDRYLAAFGRAGLRAVCEPVLAFAFQNQAALRDRLEQGGKYDALVATSPRAATALQRLFADHEGLAESWGGRRAYAVGPKTAERLQAVGLEPRGHSAGDAEALVSYIVDDAPAAHLLFLSGNRRRDTLPGGLRDGGVPFDELVVYETRTRTALALPSPTETSWLAFFSPSGLEAVAQAESVDLSDYHIAAIGPTTRGALEDAGHPVDAVAAEPSPDGLVSAITAADTGQ